MCDGGQRGGWLDALDDTHCLRGIDTKGDLNQQVLDVQCIGDVWHLGNCIPIVCALIGDSKAMLSANHHKGKCWVGCGSMHCLEGAISVPPQCRWGCYLRAIGPRKCVSDVEDGPFCHAGAIEKQLNETINGFIENGALDLGAGRKGGGKNMWFWSFIKFG